MSNVDTFIRKIQISEVNRDYLAYQIQIEEYKKNFSNLIRDSASKSPMFNSLIDAIVNQDLLPFSNKKPLTIVFQVPEKDGAGAQFSWDGNELTINIDGLIKTNFDVKATFVNFIHENIHGAEEKLAIQHGADIPFDKLNLNQIDESVQENIQQEQDAYLGSDLIRRQLAQHGIILPVTDRYSEGSSNSIDINRISLDFKNLRNSPEFQFYAAKMGSVIFPFYAPGYFDALLKSYQNNPYLAGLKLAQMMGVDPNKTIMGTGGAMYTDLTIVEWIQSQLDKKSIDPMLGPKNRFLYRFDKALKDPLVIDLGGNGLNITDLNQSKVHFAFDTNKPSTLTSWISTGSAFLVIPDTITGKVTGTNLITSFDQLSAMDTNGDGKIDVQDAAFQNLRVWQDLNLDGVSDTTELLGLADVGISSISILTQNVQQSIGSNIVTKIALVHMVDGSTREIAAVELSHSQSNIRSDAMINNFRSGIDLISLHGFSAGEINGAIAGQNQQGNRVDLSFSNSSHLTLTGVTSIQQSDFINI